MYIVKGRQGLACVGERCHPVFWELQSIAIFYIG